jgi:hypothetical protein
MKRYAAPLIVLLSILLLSACGPDADKRKPVLSLPDLMIDKLTQNLSTADSTASVALILKMRQYDKKVYDALYYDGPDDNKGTLPLKYFYARHGSCCPCAPGHVRCCDCSQGSAFAAPSSTTALVVPEGFEKNPGFMLTNTISLQDQTTYKSLDKRKDTVDGIDLFFIPEKTPEGNYRVTFTGEIELTIYIKVDGKGNFNITGLE